MINWMRYRLIYLTISGIFIFSGIFALLKWGLKLGVDFTGGAILEYKFEKEISQETVSKEIANVVSVNSIQKTSENTYLFKFPPLETEKKDQIKAKLEKTVEGKIEELRFENVGPSIGPELVKKTVVAITVSAIAILFWVAIQFKSIKFGTSAVLAMFHDSLVLIGMFAIFGHFFGAEVDFLFVTALLTILSFSVHDTIIVYDRVRETRKKIGGSMTEMANMAISQTMVRSLNNSFTIIFMLVALILLGGVTVKWFAAALLIGTISGTYSSPFVAVPILVTWDEIEKKFKGQNKLFKLLKFGK